MRFIMDHTVWVLYVYFNTESLINEEDVDYYMNEELKNQSTYINWKWDYKKVGTFENVVFSARNSQKKRHSLIG